MGIWTSIVPAPISRNWQIFVGVLLPVPATTWVILHVWPFFIDFAPDVRHAFLNFPILAVLVSQYLVEKFGMEKKKAQYPFRMATVKLGARPHIEFWAWSEKLNRLVRKRHYSFSGITDAQKLKEAKQMAREINRMLAQGYILDPEDEIQLFPSLLLDALEKAGSIRMIGASEHVKKSVGLTLSRLREYIPAAGLEKTKVEDFSKADALDFLDYLIEKRKVSNRTRNNYRDGLNSLFGVMVEREYLNINPAANIKPLRSNPGTHKAFTDDQRRTLENYLLKTNYGLYVFTRLIYYGFLRPVEILRLKISEVDLKNGIILVLAHQSKNKKQMPVVINNPLEKVLCNYLDKYQCPESYFLFSKDFKPGPDKWHRNRFSEAHRDALKKTGLYDGLLTGYSWKHTGVSNAYRAGLDIKSIQSQCRHHSLTETETYMRSLGLRTHGQIKKINW